MKKILLCISLLFTLFVPDDILSQAINDKNLFTIENISIEGNKKTRSSVIFENLPFKIGDKLTEQEIHSGIENLRKTGFFKEVNLQPRAGSERTVLPALSRRWRRDRGIPEDRCWHVSDSGLAR